MTSAVLTSTDIPKVTRHHLLVKMYKSPRKIGSLHLPESRAKDEDAASPLVVIVDMGPDAYLDTDRFPNGHLCKIGDVCMIASFAGKAKFYIGGEAEAEEYRILDDDQILAVVPDPSLIRRNL